MSASKLGHRPQLGRADLSRVLVRCEQLDEQALGAALGFDFRPLKRERVADDRGSPRSGSEPTVLRPVPHVEELEIPFWRLESVVCTPWAEDEPPTRQRPHAPSLTPLERSELGRAPSTPAPPDPPPLAPWSRLRRFLESLRRRPRPIGDIDVDVIVRDICRGCPIERIPRQLRSVRLARLVVLIDRSDRLIPFWWDQEQLWQRLRREFGGDGLLMNWWSDGPPNTRGPQLVDAVSPGLMPGDAVLVLGDLGLHETGGAAEHKRWLELGVALRDRGVLAAVLLPCPCARWPRELSRFWRAADWSNPTQGGRAATLDEAEGTARRDDLLALLSWTVRTEPALLREVRASLPWTHADVGTEADAWNHPELGRHPGGLLFPAESRHAFQARLQTIAEDSIWDVRVGDVVELVRRRHAFAARELWPEEVRTLELLGLERYLGGDEREEARLLTGRLRLTIAEGCDLGDGVDLRGWGRRALDTRVPSTGWEHVHYGDDLVLLWRMLHEGEEQSELPPGLTPARLAELEVELQVKQRWQVKQLHNEIRIEPEGMDGRGSWIASLSARTLQVAVQQPGRPSIRHALASDKATVLSLPAETEIVLATDCEALTLRRAELPRWADASGRDEHGLWASFRVRTVEQRMRWIPPGRFMSGAKAGEPGFPEVQRTIHEGYWIAESPCTQAMWVAVMGENPSAFEGAERPVERVTLGMVRQFVQKLQRLLGAGEFGLPDEDRWEYACRAGTSGATYAVPDEIAWFGESDENEGGWGSSWGSLWGGTGKAVNGTRSVGLKRPNAWGLFDTLGNVAEWCEIENTPLPSTGSSGVARGGSWRSTEVHVASREVQQSTYAAVHLGFRLFAVREWHPSWADASGDDEHGPWASVRVDDVDLRMRWTPPGRFMMGSPEHEGSRFEDEGPQHPVTITRGYWMAETPCTQALWQAVMGSNPSRFKGPELPVERVSWHDVEEFIARLDARTDPGWMLPNEAQWEYACRAETTTARYDSLDEVAWYTENSGNETHAVGQKLANKWGLHDMLGNVDEWCADGMRRYERKPIEDPTGPTSGAKRVVRGGGWCDDARLVRVAYRVAVEPGQRNDSLGFRLVRGQGLRQTSERSESRRPPFHWRWA